MSRTCKDHSHSRNRVESNEEELHQNYIREKHFKADRDHKALDACLDCGRTSGVCRLCSDDYVEDLVTIFERSCRA